MNMDFELRFYPKIIVVKQFVRMMYFLNVNHFIIYIDSLLGETHGLTSIWGKKRKENKK